MLKGGKLEIELSYGPWFNQSCLYNETLLTKTLKWGSESFWVGEHISAQEGGAPQTPQGQRLLGSRLEPCPIYLFS